MADNGEGATPKRGGTKKPKQKNDVFNGQTWNGMTLELATSEGGWKEAEDEEGLHYWVSVQEKLVTWRDPAEWVYEQGKKLFLEGKHQEALEMFQACEKVGGKPVQRSTQFMDVCREMIAKAEEEQDADKDKVDEPEPAEAVEEAPPADEEPGYEQEEQVEASAAEEEEEEDALHARALRRAVRRQYGRFHAPPKTRGGEGGDEHADRGGAHGDSDRLGVRHPHPVPLRRPHVPQGLPLGPRRGPRDGRTGDAGDHVCIRLFGHGRGDCVGRPGEGGPQLLRDERGAHNLCLPRQIPRGGCKGTHLLRHLQAARAAALHRHPVRGGGRRCRD
mmetsp:Transcript_25010/g.60118  ORF Transcript_25010/g.60118 Transcript_25010/m.60118 type:complete len:332 (-) Transcript_25010:155-1150(-)